MADAFHDREIVDEDTFRASPQAAVTSSVINHYELTTGALPGGRGLPVVRVKLVRRADKNGRDIDRDNPAGYQDYYFHGANDDSSKDKRQICLHFTAGGLAASIGVLTGGRFRPPGKDGRVNAEVGVPYVISCKGTIFELHDDKYWGHSSSAGAMNRRIIAIELVNPGPLRLKGELFYSWAGTQVCSSKDLVHEVSYRGYRYFMKHTAAQYDALRELLGYLTLKYSIPLELLKDDKGPPESSPRFACDVAKAKAFHGIVSHVNYSDQDEAGQWSKWDIGPGFEWDRLLRHPVAYPLQTSAELIASPWSYTASP